MSCMVACSAGRSCPAPEMAASAGCLDSCPVAGCLLLPSWQVLACFRPPGLPAQPMGLKLEQGPSGNRLLSASWMEMALLCPGLPVLPECQEPGAAIGVPWAAGCMAGAEAGAQQSSPCAAVGRRPQSLQMPEGLPSAVCRLHLLTHQRALASLAVTAQHTLQDLRPIHTPSQAWCAHTCVPLFVGNEQPEESDTEASWGSALWEGFSVAADAPSGRGALPLRVLANRTVDVTRDRTSLMLLWQPPQSALHATNCNEPSQ